jgi:hypothetical protein
MAATGATAPATESGVQAGSLIAYPAPARTAQARTGI